MGLDLQHLPGLTKRRVLHYHFSGLSMKQPPHARPDLSESTAGLQGGFEQRPPLQTALRTKEFLINLCEFITTLRSKGPGYRRKGFPVEKGFQCNTMGRWGEPA